MIIEIIERGRYELTPVPEMEREQLCAALGSAIASREVIPARDLQLGKPLNSSLSLKAVKGACDINRTMATVNGEEWPTWLDDPITEGGIREVFFRLGKNLASLRQDAEAEN